MLTGATSLPPLCSSALVDAADAAVWAVLGSAGCTPAEARIIADVIWADR
jgi:hypothetical protein